MTNDDFIDNRLTLAKQFESIFQRLLAGETPSFYEEGVNVSFLFQIIAEFLLADVPEREFMAYDGVENLTAKVKTQRQVEFKGEMLVFDDNAYWEEEFRATVTDKRITKQGIWVIIWVGADRAEGELSSAFGLAE